MYIWERKRVCVCVWIVSDSFATNQKKFRKNLLQRNTSLVSTRTKKMPSNYFFVGICLSDGLDIKEPLKMIYDANKCNFFPPTFNASKPKKQKQKLWSTLLERRFKMYLLPVASFYGVDKIIVFSIHSLRCNSFST